jgi:hypothetical protein
MVIGICREIVSAEKIRITNVSVGLQGSCILILDPDRFDLTVGGRRRLFSWTRTTL